MQNTTEMSTHTHTPTIIYVTAQVGKHEEHKADCEEFYREFLEQKVTTASFHRAGTFLPSGTLETSGGWS